MIVYLASPRSQQQAEHACDMPVLLSFAIYDKFMDRYQQTFSRILIDSGAFSEFSSGVKVDLAEYRDWSQRWIGHADAIAGLDDISGDWRRGIANYERMPWAFPTWHDTDPLDIIGDLVAMARERGGWIGIGLKPPRQGKETIVREVCSRIPDGLHVHGWALRAYTNIRRIDSVDSTDWWREALSIGGDFPWLTHGEALEIVVKRYKRWKRTITESRQTELWK